MAKHCIIWTDGGEDNIEVYNNEPVIVVHCERADLESLSSIDEANLPGVYILYHENKRYVGQASKSVYSRISKHDKSKNWWSSLLIIGREDGRLDKSQLDFLEHKLITDFHKAEMELDNGTVGNSSHIETYQRGKAQQVLSQGLKIIEDDIKINLFKRCRSRNIKRSLVNTPNKNLLNEAVVTSIQEIEPKQKVIEDLEVTTNHRKKRINTLGFKLGEKEFSERSVRSSYLELLHYLSETTTEFDEKMKIVSGRLGGKLYLKTELVSENKLYSKITDDYSVYSTLANDRIKKIISNINEVFNTEIQFIDMSL